MGRALGMEKRGGGVGFLVTLLEGWFGLIWWWDEGWRWLALGLWLWFKGL